MKRITTLLLIVLFKQLTVNAQCSIAGHLYDKDKKKNLSFVEIRLLGFPLKYRTSTYSDSLGNYYLDGIPEGKHSFQFNSPDYKDTVVEDIPFVKDSITYVNIIYPTFCEFSEKKSICPVCLKMNKVIPIKYGDPLKRTRKKSKNGKIKLGGCRVTGCDPHWYCKRDDKKF